MNVGAIALVTGGALLMHAALTAQSPLADLQSIFKTGKVSMVIGGQPTTTNTPAGKTIAPLAQQVGEGTAVAGAVAGLHG